MTAVRTFVLLGHPVGHSVSPAIHEAAYRELGSSDCSYVAIDCPDRAAVERQIRALRDGEIFGANVTVPWKRVALELADERDPSAASTGAANVLRLAPSGTVVAHNTDVRALAGELVRGRERARRSRRAAAPAEAGSAVVIGSGGAALAAVAACREIGVDRVSVVARKFRDSNPALWERANEFRRLGAAPVAWPEHARAETAFAEAVRASDFVVQTTSDGMHGATDGAAVRDLVPWESLVPTAYVYDVVYNPGVTPFVEAARARGFCADTGLGMLVGQAAAAIELWLGQAPSVEPLRLAAEEALARKGRA